MKKKKAKKKILKKHHRFNMKLSEHHYKMLQKLAKVFTHGNVSAYMKTASLRYIPKRGEKFKAIAPYRKLD